MANAIISLPLGYFPDPNKGRPLGNAKIYIGVADLNPRILANQLPVTGRQESGEEVTVSQPVRTSFGGVPVDDNGNVVTIMADGASSMAIDDSKDDQKYYFANTFNGVPLVLADVGSAAFVNIGTSAGQLPTTDDLGMIGGTNYNSANYPFSEAGEIGTCAVMKNETGGIVLNGTTLTSGDVEYAKWDAAGLISGGQAVVAGMWINKGGTISAGGYGSFTRVS